MVIQHRSPQLYQLRTVFFTSLLLSEKPIHPPVAAVQRAGGRAASEEHEAPCPEGQILCQSLILLPR